jgi:hypothetical protein
MIRRVQAIFQNARAWLWLSFILALIWLVVFFKLSDFKTAYNCHGGALGVGITDKMSPCSLVHAIAVSDMMVCVAAVISFTVGLTKLRRTV